MQEEQKHIVELTEQYMTRMRALNLYLAEDDLQNSDTGEAARLAARQDEEVHTRNLAANQGPSLSIDGQTFVERVPEDPHCLVPTMLMAGCRPRTLGLLSYARRGCSRRTRRGGRGLRARWSRQSWPGSSSSTPRPPLWRPTQRRCDTA